MAAFAMTILEIARLVAERLGVGLLPISTIALMLVFALLWGEKKGRTLEVSLVSSLACRIVLIPGPNLFDMMVSASWVLLASPHRLRDYQIYQTPSSDGA